MKSKWKRICVSASLIALSTVLSFIKVWQMPLGGSVTLLSMLPVCLIAVFYGTPYAIAPCLLYGVIQIFLGSVFSWGLSAKVLVAAIFLDYVVPYGFMCLSGLFRKYRFGAIYGVALACFARFCCHFVSGIVLWESFDVFNNPWIYSLVYNGAYMLPDMILCLIIGAVLFKPLGKYIRGEDLKF